MIKTFKSKGLADLFSTGKSSKVQPKHVKKLKVILSMLNAATYAGQMSAPGLRFHPLEPKKAGRYAVSVDENYRVTFKLEGQDATEVDYEYYH